MSLFDLVIFDCDGVLVDSEPVVMTVFIEMLRDLGLSMTLDEALERFMGTAPAEELRSVEGMLDHPLPKGFAEEYHQRTITALHTRILPVEGIQETLAELDIPFCVASNGDDVRVRAALGGAGLLPLFEGRIISVTDVRRPKPFPDIYLFAAQRFGVVPKCCAVIEDTPIGVTAGVAAGMFVVGYSKYIDADRLRAAGAAVIFDDMRELARLLISEHPNMRRGGRVAD